MIDYTVLVISNFTFGDYQKFLDLVDIEMPTESEKMVVHLENLKLEYYPNAKMLKIRNSLHKFYNRTYADIKIDGNHNDFCFSNFVSLSYMLSEFYFERDLKEFKISTKLETGINIDTGGYKPMDILERYQSFQVCNSINHFETIDTWGGTIGKPKTRKVFMSDYQLKLYNKSAESKLAKVNLLRMEIVYGQLRKIRSVLGVTDISLETLTELKSWLSLGNYLNDCYNNIKKIPFTSRDLTVDELNKVYAFCNKSLKKDLATHLSRHNYSKYIDECKEVYNKISQSEDNYHNVIGDKIFSKIKYLCNH